MRDTTSGAARIAIWMAVGVTVALAAPRLAPIALEAYEESIVGPAGPDERVVIGEYAHMYGWTSIPGGSRYLNVRADKEHVSGDAVEGPTVADLVKLYVAETVCTDQCRTTESTTILPSDALTYDPAAQTVRVFGNVPCGTIDVTMTLKPTPEVDYGGGLEAPAIGELADTVQGRDPSPLLDLPALNSAVNADGHVTMDLPALNLGGPACGMGMNEGGYGRGARALPPTR